MSDFKLPTRSPRPRLEKICIHIRNDEMFLDRVVDEAAISYPVPGFENNKPTIYLFHYWIKDYPDRHVTRPLTVIAANVSVTSDEAEIFRHSIAQPEIPIFPHLNDPAPNPPEDIPLELHKSLSEVLYESCDELLKNYASLSPDIGRLYANALRRLSWPGLLPYYRALNPDFFAAIDL